MNLKNKSKNQNNITTVNKLHFQSSQIIVFLQPKNQII